MRQSYHVAARQILPPGSVDTMMVCLYTSHGTIIGIDHITRSLKHGDIDKIIPLIGVLHSTGSIVLIASDNRDFHSNIGAIGRESGILSIRAYEKGNSNIAIQDNLTEKYLSAEPGGNCVINRNEVLGWELFNISTPEGLILSDACRNRISGLSNWSASTPPASLELKDAAEMAVGCLEGQDLQDYLDKVHQDSRFTNWRDLFGDRDPWLNANSTVLEGWALDGRKRSALTGQDWLMQPNYDYLADMACEGQFVSRGYVASLYQRSKITPNRKCCIVTTVRNEGVYLIDWIAYHSSLGFDAIFVYSNNNDDGSDALLQALDAAGEIIWMRNSVNGGTSPQYKAYGHAFGIQPDILDFEWALLIDLDEYLVIDESKFGNVGEFLDWQRDLGATSIMLTWQVIGSSGQSVWHDRPVPERFDDRQEREPTLTKCFTRPNITSHSHCHFPWISRLFPMKCLDARGDAVPEFIDNRNTASSSIISRATRKEPILENAWINHYWYKSTEEFLARRTYAGGGESIVNNPTIPPVFAAHFAGQNIGISDTGIAPHMPGLLKNRERLLSFPGIRAAHDDVCTQYSNVLNEKLLSNMQSDDASIRALVDSVLSAKTSG